MAYAVLIVWDAQYFAQQAKNEYNTFERRLWWEVRLGMDGMRRGIVVLDFGSQYNQLIARRVRELGVYSVLVPAYTPIADIVAMRPEGIIFSGGPASVYDDDAPRVDPGVYALGVPILGICYGMQMIAAHFGGRVEAAKRSEYGAAIVQFAPYSPLTAHVPQEQSVWMSHSDHIVTPPEGFVVDGRTDGAIAAMSDRARGVYAVQFHPEVEHTQYGLDMLRAFVLDVCGCAQQWTAHTFIDDAIGHIKRTVGDRRVLCALSGGVDSSVVAALLHRAIGDQLTCMFIDHGLLRQGEAEAVMDTFAGEMDMHVVAIDARAQFLEAIADVDDPEMKRKRIGRTFIETFEREAKKLGTFAFLAQGTLYSDVVESGTATAQTIKSHHNVGGLPERMQFALIEPLRELFKDEVRRVGEALGLPAARVWRQPFPGPGLAIRIIGAVTEEKLRIVRASDAIVHEELVRAQLDREVWQYFTTLTNVRSVGVMGDRRTYAYTVGVRAVTSVDGMTADWARLPYDVLHTISRRIVNEVTDVNRVVYDITSKPPSTIEWE